MNQNMTLIVNEMQQFYQKVKAQNKYNNCFSRNLHNAKGYNYKIRQPKKVLLRFIFQGHISSDCALPVDNIRENN